MAKLVNKMVINLLRSSCREPVIFDRLPGRFSTPSPKYKKKTSLTVPMTFSFLPSSTISIAFGSSLFCKFKTKDISLDILQILKTSCHLSCEINPYLTEIMFLKKKDNLKYA